MAAPATASNGGSSGSNSTCMNVLCGAATSSRRKGWPLRSGGVANLCDTCGSAYEQSIFCDVFHLKDSGWRDCTSCGKRLHCGCIASQSLLQLLDTGGVSCISCSNSTGVNLIKDDEKPGGLGIMPRVNNVGEMQCNPADHGLAGERKFMQLQGAEGIGTRHLLQLRNDSTFGSYRQMKKEESPIVGEIRNTSFSHFSHAINGSSQAPKPEIHDATTIPAKELYESLAQTSLSITLGSSSGNPTGSGAGAFVDERAPGKSSQLQQGSRSRHLLPKPPKLSLASSLEPNSGMVSQIRVARPPAEGRGRTQLLPRYWPRITDQELQQISGDSNSTIVPLFEKVLSASDAGRIGRLVLPKACAEAYFPPISQPEGLPLRIQDIKGKEWVFQFRFWPNNNSRMYVLEGVTPCIQSMQLQAGDTVTFSRMDPEGKLVMGFRKASSSIPMQSLKGSNDPPLSALSKHLHPASGDMSWYKSEKHVDKVGEDFFLPSLLVPERKRTRNIGSKTKRLLIDSLDALELKLTWEEAQDLLRPPSVNPSIVTIEDHDFEEYEEPPIFGKRSIFIVRTTGGQEQWAQCDGCSKWRRLPVDVLLPPKWTCMDNAWDQSRCSCSAPDELTPRELENLLGMSMDFKKRRLTNSNRSAQESESPGLDALASAAIMGGPGDSGNTVVATTTKHPRHRPGCSCIVCIQPPSGKGKHKPTCTCTVCMTVKRRFKTMMMRKKKRQSEREAEIAQRSQQLWVQKDEEEADSSSKIISTHLDPSDNDARSVNELESKSQSNDLSNKLVDDGKGHLDLNCHPEREEESQVGARVSMMSLLQVASLPLDNYLKENGLTSLVTEQQTSSPALEPTLAGEVEGQVDDNPASASAAQDEQDSESEDTDEPQPGQNQDEPE